jgi:uncharacterized protein
MADKSLLSQIFMLTQPSISEFTFANLFLFRNAHNYHISELGDSLVIRGKGYGGEEYCLPPLGGDIETNLVRMLSTGREIYALDEPLITMCANFRDSCEITEDRDAFDYVYQRSDLAMLPGNRYHKKKNRINYFTNRHAYSVEPFSDKFQDGALQLLDDWSCVRCGSDNPSSTLEAAATAEGIIKAGQLDLQGVVVLVEGRVRAFALGERLNNTTAVCHFEKADPFMEGLSQLVNQAFSTRCFTDCEYINREQDLGEANLRAAKLSYHPVSLVKKYRVRSKGLGG